MVPIPAESPYRSLLVDAIDFAGLFPPAALGLAAAVEAYAEYRRGQDAWALGRFILPAARLGEFAEVAGDTLAVARSPWLLSVTCGPDWADDVTRIEQFSHAIPLTGARVDTVEFRADTIAMLLDVLGSLPAGLNRFAEIPLDHDPVPFVAALKLRGAGAKFRTGGVTPEAFPTPGGLLRALEAVVRAAVPFKCTAGLHHPVRGTYRLTYQPDSASAPMYGYLNVFLATAALVQGEGIDSARDLLLEEDASAFAATGGDLAWRGIRFERPLLRALRRRGMRSFGSCSFREPLDELASLVMP